MSVVDRVRQNSLPLCFSLGLMVGVNTATLVIFPHALALGLACCGAYIFFVETITQQNPLRFRWVSIASRGVFWFVAGLLLALVCIFRMGSYYGSEHIGMPAHAIRSFDGTLVGDALHAKKGYRATIKLTEVGDANGLRADSSARVLVYFESQEAFYAGDVLSFTCEGLKDIRSTIWSHLGFARLVDQKKAKGPAGLRGRILTNMESALPGLSPDVRGFVFALLLGRQDELDPDMQTAFYGSGCAHLVALSGMHIAIVAAALVSLVKPLIGINGARLLGFIGASVFIWIAGPFPSALRALVMFALFQLSAFVGRKVSGISILCLSGPVLACIDPFLPLSLGFQLSFWALFGIMICQDSLQRLLRRPLLPLLSFEFSTGIAAQLGTSLLLGAHGLPVQPQGLVAGIVLAPLVLGFMALSTLVLVLGLFGLHPIVTILSPLLNVLYNSMLAIGSFFAFRQN